MRYIEVTAFHAAHRISTGFGIMSLRIHVSSIIRHLLYRTHKVMHEYHVVLNEL